MSKRMNKLVLQMLDEDELLLEDDVILVASAKLSTSTLVESSSTFRVDTKFPIFSSSSCELASAIKSESMFTNIGSSNYLNENLYAVEYFDKNRLYYILSHAKKYQAVLNAGIEGKRFRDDIRIDMLDLIRRYFMLSLNQAEYESCTQTGRILVNYRNRNGSGRLFANNSLSLQNINHKIRHAIAGEYYTDIDIVNAHPVILEYICKRNNIPCGHLIYYNKNRDMMIAGYVTEGFSREEIKNLLFTIIGGGKGIYNKVRRKKINNNWIKKFYGELVGIRLALRLKYVDRYEQIVDLHMDDEDEVDDEDEDDAERKKHLLLEGQLISSLMCDGENLILKSMINFFKREGIINKLGRMDAVLCFDGIMINTRTTEVKDWISKNAQRILEECEIAVRTECGIDVKIKIKPMDKGVKMPRHIGCRPDPVNDIFMYGNYFKNAKNFESVCKLKHDLVSFINKDTCLVYGSLPVIIKEEINYKTKDEYSNGSIKRVYKIDKGYAIEMANVHFNTCLSADEVKEHNLTPKDLVIDGYKNWLTSRYRNSKKEIIFDPKFFYDNRPTTNIYNLFNGFDIERYSLKYVKPLKETEPFFQHIYNNWCLKNRKAYEYVLNWFAWIIQYPWKKLRTSIVLKSVNRTGKGIIVDQIRKILGENYVFHPTNPKEILGDFNAGCRNKLLIFMDELVWGGDKERSGVFKKLITEKTMSINEKFKSAITIANLMNLIIASNETWCAPVGETETRFFILLLSPWLATCSKKESKKMIDDINNTDTRRLAKFLYLRDVANWNSDNIVVTDELREQKIHSMNKINKWWFECLNNGYFLINTRKLYFGDNRIIREDLFACYKEYSNDKHMVNKSFNKMFVELSGVTKVSRPRIDGVQVRCVDLPKIETVYNIWRKKYADAKWQFDIPEIRAPEDEDFDIEE